MELLYESKTVIKDNPYTCAPRIAFIGFGEVAYYMIKGLKRDGIEELAVYTRFTQNKKVLSAKAVKAAEVGAYITFDMEDLLEKSDIIFSTVRGHVALETARKAAEWIRPGQLYVDLNNANPSVKKEASDLILEKGAKFVDVGLFGLPVQLENKALMYASGRSAEEFKDIMTLYGMNIVVTPGEIGQASKMKALINIYLKCLQGVSLEFAISAKSAGVSMDELEPLLTIAAADIPREKEIGFWIIRGALLAERKKEEMKDAMNMLEDLQIDPIMLTAAVERLERVSKFHLNQDFDASIPYQKYNKILDRMFKNGKEGHIEVR